MGLAVQPVWYGGDMGRPRTERMGSGRRSLMTDCSYGGLMRAGNEKNGSGHGGSGSWRLDGTNARREGTEVEGHRGVCVQTRMSRRTECQANERGIEQEREKSARQAGKQAGRQAGWETHTHTRHGCYNQETDRPTDQTQTVGSAGHTRLCQTWQSQV